MCLLFGGPPNYGFLSFWFPFEATKKETLKKTSPVDVRFTLCFYDGPLIYISVIDQESLLRVPMGVCPLFEGTVSGAHFGRFQSTLENG